MELLLKNLLSVLPRSPKKQKAKNNFYCEIKKVIQQSNVILSVLDARDPLGSRCYAIEEFLKTEAPEKKIIFILNKIDLIPKENFIEWLRYLTEIHPTVGFKCVFTSHIQSIGQIGQSTVAPQKKVASIGEDLLLNLLRETQKEMGQPITVGIIGYPNVGKSSLINSLKKMEKVSVGALPGFTKVAEEITLEKDIKLIDSPGVIFSKKRDGVDCLLRNLVEIEQIANPVQILQDIYNNSKTERFLTNFRLTKFNSFSEFLKRMGEKKASYRKPANAARGVLRDLVVYRFPFYLVPPKTETTNFRQALQALKTHEPVLKSLIGVNEALYLPINSAPPSERAASQVSLETLKEIFEEVEQINQQNNDAEDEEMEENDVDDVEENDEDEGDDDDEGEDDGENFNIATDFVASHN
jgi:nuclear GTP-binding protein